MQYVEQPVTWCEMWRVDMSLESAHTTRVHGPCLRHAPWTSEQVHGCYHFGIRVPSTREHGHCPTMLFQHGRCYTVTTRDDGCSTHYTVFTGSEPHVGGRPVPSWARVSGVADARRMEFSNSSWQFRAVKSLICSFNNSISSRTANSRWLFTRSYDDSNQSTLILFYFILAIILFQRPAHVK